MSRYIQGSPWTDAGNVGQGIGNTLSEALLKLPMLRWQLLQEAEKDRREQQAQQRQEQFERDRLTEETRHNKVSEQNIANRFTGSQQARDRAAKEKISEFDAAQELKREEDDQRVDDRAQARADANNRAKTDLDYKNKSLSQKAQAEKDLQQFRNRPPQPKIELNPLAQKGDPMFYSVTPSGATPIQSTVQSPPPSGPNAIQRWLGIGGTTPTPPPQPGASARSFSATNMPPMNASAPAGPTNAPPTAVAPSSAPPQPQVMMPGAPQAAPVAAPQPPVGVPSAPVATPAPQVAAPPPAAAAPAMIRVRHPNGQTGTIPASALQQAIKAGYTPLQ
jgi:hypothetical protein